MSFNRRKGRGLPSQIASLDFADLHNSQVWILSDWMGCRRAVGALNSEETRRAALKEYCMKDLERAQQGYEVICLLKTPAASGAIAPDVEKRMFQVLTDVCEKHREALSSYAGDAVDAAMKDVGKRFTAMAQEALREAAEKARPIVIKDGGKIKKIAGVFPVEFPRMIQLASARIPIMLVGPAGCGKTFLAEKLAEALSLEYSDQSCSEGMSESVFNGFLLPTGKAGAFEHHTSPFMDRYETGGVMLLDEIDAADSNLTTYMNKAVANKSYTVAQRFNDPVVKKHKDFVLVAAANTFGHGADAMYVGRNQLDAATLDRFKVGLIQMDYSREVEATKGPAELCEWAWAIRDKIRHYKLRRIMSTRVIEHLGIMTERYDWGRKEWDEAYFTGWSDEDRRLVA